MSSFNTVAQVSDRARALVKDSIVIDSLYAATYERAFLERAETGGLTAMLNTPSYWPETFRQTLLKLLYVWQFVDKNADRCILVDSVADIRRAKAEGKTAVILGSQQADCLENDLATISYLSRMGLKSIQLTYTMGNQIGRGCGEPEDARLTAFGRKVVQELNTFGILIDLSHVGRLTTLDAIDRSDAPCAITHSLCRAKAGHSRAKSDEEILALAKRGGVIGIMAEGPQYKKLDANGKGLQPLVSDYVDHVEHVIQLTGGVDNVGIGTDITEFITAENWKPFAGQYAWYDYPATPIDVKGMEHAGEAYLNVTEELLHRNYKDDDIKKIIGGNWLRVFDAAWKKKPATESLVKLDPYTHDQYHYPPYYPQPGY
jgi:membrane dipeptidase